MLHSLLYQDHCCKRRLLEKVWIYCDADVWLLVTGKRSIPILGDHGDLLEGWCLRTHTWMPVLSQWVGITGERLKTKEAPAFMNTSKWMHLPSMNTCVSTDFGSMNDVHHRLCFEMVRCFGPGSCPSKRVTWCRELIDEEAEEFVAHSFIDPDRQRPWLAPRMAIRVPYSA